MDGHTSIGRSNTRNGGTGVNVLADTLQSVSKKKNKTKKKQTDHRNQRSCIWPLNKVAAHVNSQRKAFFAANFAMLEAGNSYLKGTKA